LPFAWHSDASLQHALRAPALYVLSASRSATTAARPYTAAAGSRQPAAGSPLPRSGNPAGGGGFGRSARDWLASQPAPRFSLHSRPARLAALWVDEWVTRHPEWARACALWFVL